MSITLEQYIEFYNENENIISMKEGSNYPINKKGLQQWVDSVKNKKNNILCDNLSDVHKAYDKEAINNCDNKDNSDTYNLFAYMFSKILRHISFKEMCDRIKLIVAEIITLYTTNNYVVIYIFIDGIAQKSNTWLSLLYVKYLLELKESIYKIITHLIKKSKVIDDFADIDNEVSNNKKILILHIDDMIYSGKQVDESIIRNRKHINNIIEKAHNKTIDYYLCVAYISNNARKLFTKYTYVKFFKNTEVINNFLEQSVNLINDNSNFLTIQETLNTKNSQKTLIQNLSILCGTRDPYVYTLGSISFKCHSASPLLAVYFDHKLPDIVSFFNRIVNYGMFPANTDDSGNYMTFKNDKIQYKSPAEHIITNCNINENTDKYGIQKDCPPAFYKQLQYKFKSNDIYMGDKLETKYYIVAQISGILNNLKTDTTNTKSPVITSPSYTSPQITSPTNILPQITSPTNTLLLKTSPTNTLPQITSPINTLLLKTSPQITSPTNTLLPKTKTKTKKNNNNNNNNNNTYDSKKFDNDLKKLKPVNNIQIQTYDKFKENVILDNSFENTIYTGRWFYFRFKEHAKDYNIFYILYAFIILYFIIVYKFKLDRYNSNNFILLSDVIRKLLHKYTKLFNNNSNESVIANIQNIYKYLENTFIIDKNKSKFDKKLLSHYLDIDIDIKTNIINTITIKNIT